MGSTNSKSLSLGAKRAKRPRKASRSKCWKGPADAASIGIDNIDVNAVHADALYVSFVK